MKLIVSLVATLIVFIFVSLTGLVEFRAVNDSLSLGWIFATITYWMVSFLAGFLLVILVGVSGGLLGAALGANKNVINGCALVTIVALAVIVDLLILMNMYKTLDWFPQFNLSAAIIVTVATSAITLVYNRTNNND